MAGIVNGKLAVNHNGKKIKNNIGKFKKIKSMHSKQTQREIKSGLHLGRK